MVCIPANACILGLKSWCFLSQLCNCGCDLRACSFGGAGAQAPGVRRQTYSPPPSLRNFINTCSNPSSTLPVLLPSFRPATTFLWPLAGDVVASLWSAGMLLNRASTACCLDVSPDGPAASSVLDDGTRVPLSNAQIPRLLLRRPLNLMNTNILVLWSPASRGPEHECELSVITIWVPTKQSGVSGNFMLEVVSSLLRPKPELWNGGCK